MNNDIYPYLELQAIMVYGKPESRCLLTVHREKIEAVVIFDELDNSIINNITGLANRVLKDYHLRLDYITWIAHLRSDEDEFYRLYFNWDGEAFYDVRWRRINRYEIESCLDGLIKSFRMHSNR